MIKVIYKNKDFVIVEKPCGVLSQKDVNGENGLVEILAEQLGGEYIFALNCMNVPADQGAITFEVTTYYQLEGMDTFEEVTVKFTVDPAKDIPNADVK